MNPPARPIRTEVTDAVVGGIRQRGPEAVGLVIIGVARIVIAVLVLALLLVAGSVIGIEVEGLPFAGMTGISGLLSLLVVRADRWNGNRGGPSNWEGP